MEEVDVELVATETRQAVTARLQNLLPPEAAPAAGHSGAGRDLGRDQEGVADPLQSQPDHRLIARLEIVLGRVQPVHTVRDRRLDHADRAGAPRAPGLV